ncbi:2-keto-4-pentenoate hydratase [Pseudomonas juntendi]|uniref:2-keto-4-pentenoate hydratase n=1 Tax=Pseudomonas juntendi TaxID=2666183 RepID=A0ABD4Y9M3_9PSED|nr:MULTISPECIES: 2-keto-4-pentenoate hydratase [Pseudomonas]MDH0756182.1 2-keto-4-pentenoate hydratase [Pseudomonas juntendi]MDH1919866.1 2-keto-4-pentenoate hydratase [Pseudomonas juntendi]RRV65063.1 2-keto-4-pentenoate hydratase [Pseudomonas sp. p99-361]SUD79725.1 lyase [Pseudomonas putida]
MSGLAQLLNRLREATIAAAPLPSQEGEQLDVVQGYCLLCQALQQRRNSGEKLVGWKVAFASKAAYERFGLSEPVYGALTDVMQIPARSTVDLERFIQPKLEVELAFVLTQNLPADSYTDEQLLAAVGYMAPAFEIADSRWQGWRFSAGAFLADNACAAAFCLGELHPFDAMQAARLEYSLYSDDALLAKGSLGERDDTPLRNLCWLLRRLLADGYDLESGQIILSGLLLPPMDLKPNHYQLDLLGSQLALTFTSASPA